MSDLIKSFKDLKDNAKNFAELKPGDGSQTLKVLRSFKDWYFFPDLDIFAPCKFIGYKNTTVENYKSDGHGGTARENIERWKFFNKIEHNSPEFLGYLKKLEFQLKPFNKENKEKEVNADLLKGDGGIYIPNLENQEVYELTMTNLQKTVEDDLSSIDEESNYKDFEGGKIFRLINYYERNSKLRTEAIKIHGKKCKVCDFDFEKTYGKRGKDYIEVHHLKPLHTLDKPEEVNPETDMTVLCSNCHRMIHRKKNAILSLDALKNILIEKA